MRGFDDVKLTWNGETKTVPAEDAFELVMRIEDVLNDGSGIPAYVKLMANTHTTSRLSVAYAAALQFAGFDVRPQDVYLSIESACAEGDIERASTTHNALCGLLAIIAPNITESLKVSDGEDPEKK